MKYRRAADYGSGFEYITPDKIHRLRYAAVTWAVANKFTGDMQIVLWRCPVIWPIRGS